MSYDKYTTEALILKSYENGENDLAYKVFTYDFGIIFVHAKSVRKINSKLRMKLNVNNFCLITLVKGKELWRVTGVEEMNNIKKDQNRLAILCECISRFIPIEKSQKKLFEKLKNIVIDESNVLEISKFKILIYYIVLVDTGYADAKIIGAKDIDEYKSFSVSDLYTHFSLNEKYIIDHVIYVLKHSML